jgi:hypothetical protein
VRSLKKADWKKFENLLAQEMDGMGLDSGPEEMALKLECAGLACLDTVAPLHQLTKGHAPACPWWSPAMKSHKYSIHWLRLRLTASPELKRQYNRVKRRLAKLVAKGRNSVWREFCSKHKAAPWGALAKYIKGQDGGLVRLEPSSSGEDAQSIATKALDKFCHPLPQDANSRRIPLSKANLSRDDPPFTMLELRRALRARSSSQASGPDGIPQPVWIRVIDKFAHTFLLLFNSILSSGCFL